MLSAVLLLLSLLVSFSKDAGFLLIQLKHSALLNIIFNLLTFPGDGISCVVIVLILFGFVSYRKAITLMCGYLLGSLFVQSVKVYFDNPRPAKWFELESIDLVLPEGLSPHMWSSFPSGHSAASATLFLFLAGITGKPQLQILCALAAILVGYSRIYLYMHFPEDVVTGFIVGLLSMWYADRFLARWFEKAQKPWENKSFFLKE